LSPSPVPDRARARCGTGSDHLAGPPRSGRNGHQRPVGSLCGDGPQVADALQCRRDGRTGRAAPPRLSGSVQPRTGERGDHRCPHRPPAVRAAVWLLDPGSAPGVSERGQADCQQAEPDRRVAPGPRAALADPGRLVGGAGRSGVRCKKGAITTLSPTPPGGSVPLCLEERGPGSARSDPGRQLLRTAPPDPTAPAPRARQERDAGHHGSGDLFGAFRPATGEAFTAP
jgi:hypothetical protein